MGSWIIALLVGLGGGAWVWNKTMKETNRQDTSAILAVVTLIIVFLVLLSVFKLFLHM